MSDSVVKELSPVTLNDLISENDAITGGLISVQTTIHPLVVRVDDLCIRQAKFSDNLEKLRCTTPPPPTTPKKLQSPAGGTAALALIVSLFFLGGVAANYVHKPKEVPMSNAYDEGMRLMRSSQYEQAMACFIQATVVPGADIDLCGGRTAECMFRLKLYPEVMSICHKIEHDCPNSPKAAFWRAAVYKQNGDKASAVEWFTKAHDRGDQIARLELALLQPSVQGKKKEK